MKSNIPNDKVRGSSISKNYLYLNMCSTEDQMVVLHYLNGVHTVKDPLTLHTNAGKSETNKRGCLGGMVFWLNEKSIANVICLKTLEQKFHVMYDSKKQGGAFVCYTPKGTILFERCAMTKFPYINHERDKLGVAAMLMQII